MRYTKQDLISDLYITDYEDEFKEYKKDFKQALKLLNKKDSKLVPVFESDLEYEKEYLSSIGYEMNIKHNINGIILYEKEREKKIMNKLDIFKHLELTDSIENSFARQVASDILKDTNLKGKKYYDAEDKITMIINNHLKRLSNGRCRNTLDRYSEKTYRESYDDFIEHTDLVLYKVVVASEVDHAIEEVELDLNESEYELVCNFIYNWWLDVDDYDIYNIAYQFLNCIKNNKFTIDDITDNYNKVHRIFNESIF